MNNLREIIKFVNFIFPSIDDLDMDYWKLREGFRFPEDAVNMNASISSLKRRLEELGKKIENKMAEMEKDMEAGDPWKTFKLGLDELNDILGPEEKR